MKIHAAVTLPVNPPSASPTLTLAQCWKGLDEKARRPMPFVPISECTITEDRGAAGITRRVRFAPGGPYEGEVTEVITYHGETQATFEMVEHPMVVQNILSAGDSDTELYLTFSFAREFPEIDEGAAEAAARATAGMRKMGAGAVRKTIDVIRQLVVDGKL